MTRRIGSAVGTVAAGIAVLVGIVGCSSAVPHSATPATSLGPQTISATPDTSTSVSPTTSATTAATTSPSGLPSTRSHPVIVLDPGHSPVIKSVDAATGLVDSDYENEPEMRDMFAVAQLIKTKLEADGYRVVMTKNSATDRVSLGQRAAIANNAHAALALSLHDQAGANGGIAFAKGNNMVYYQSVGGYRTTPTGTRITFTDATLAATSKRYGQIFQTQRTAVEGHPVRLLGGSGYDLASRGLPAGDMWMVQLLAKVPWIYNEAGGNSVGLAGLSSADMNRYAAGVVAGVEACVPIPH